MKRPAMDVVGVGALNLDTIYRVERILEDGEAIVKEAAQFPGGSSANTIYGLARLGLRTGFVGAVGDDAAGRTLLEDFESVGVDTTQIKLKPHSATGSALCLSDRLGRRSIYVLPGANSLMSAGDVDPDYVNRAALLHISSFASADQLQMLKDVVGGLAPSVRVSFSPGMLYAALGLETLKPLLARTHLLILNATEMRQLTGEDAVNGSAVCLEQGCRIVVVTLGGTSGDGNGTPGAVCYVRDGHGGHLVAARPADTVSAVDTTGAGDAFAAGFIYGLLGGRDLDECSRLGDMTARFAITRAGARQGLPDAAELGERYRRFYGEQP